MTEKNIAVNDNNESKLEIEELIDSNDSLATELGAIAKNSDSLQIQLENNIEKYNQLSIISNSLRSNLSILENQIELYKDSVIYFKNQINDFNNLIDLLNVSNDSLNKQVDSLKNINTITLGDFIAERIESTRCGLFPNLELNSIKHYRFRDDTMNVNVRIENLGLVDAYNFNVYLSDLDFNNVDTSAKFPDYINEVILEEKANNNNDQFFSIFQVIDTLKAGETIDLNFSLDFDAINPNLELVGVIDPENRIQECDKSNNVLWVIYPKE